MTPSWALWQSKSIMSQGAAMSPPANYPPRHPRLRNFQGCATLISFPLSTWFRQRGQEKIRTEKVLQQQHDVQALYTRNTLTQQQLYVWRRNGAAVERFCFVWWTFSVGEGLEKKMPPGKFLTVLFTYLLTWVSNLTWGVAPQVKAGVVSSRTSPEFCTYTIRSKQQFAQPAVYCCCTYGSLWKAWLLVCSLQTCPANGRWWGGGYDLHCRPPPPLANQFVSGFI